MLLKQVTLVGVGLLGGSIGLAVKQRQLARRVVGLVRREASVAECGRLGIADEITLDPATALAGADLVILGTPVLQMRALARQIAPHLRRGAIVTDVGSVKARLVADLEPLFAQAGAYFVGSHPMAGGEQMGPAAARADLFKDAVCVVTPTAQSSPTAVRKVERFWRDLGGRTVKMAPDMHDQLTARSSHLPHVAASALARLVLDPAASPAQSGLCATGFRDTTRVASGSPEMWRDIVLENRAQLLPAVADLRKELQQFERFCRKGDPDALLDFFTAAKQRRDAWLAGLAAKTSPTLE